MEINILRVFHAVVPGWKVPYNLRTFMSSYVSLVVAQFWCCISFPQFLPVPVTLEAPPSFSVYSYWTCHFPTFYSQFLPSFTVPSLWAFSDAWYCTMSQIYSLLLPPIEFLPSFPTPPLCNFYWSLQQSSRETTKMEIS